jgi:chromosome segregation ATPase
MPPSGRGGRGGGGGGGWGALQSFSTRGEGERAMTEAILSLALDGDDTPSDPEALLRALRVAQTALRGEKTRCDTADERARRQAPAAAPAPSDTAAQELAGLREKLRVTEDELQEIREERDELTEDLAAFERKERTGGRRSVGAGGSTANELRSKVEELESEARDLRIKNKDLVREAGRKDEIINARSQSLDESRTTLNTERDERRQLEEDVRVMRSQIRDCAHRRRERERARCVP